MDTYGGEDRDIDSAPAHRLTHRANNQKKASKPKRRHHAAHPEAPVEEATDDKAPDGDPLEDFEKDGGGLSPGDEVADPDGYVVGVRSNGNAQTIYMLFLSFFRVVFLLSFGAFRAVVRHPIFFWRVNHVACRLACIEALLFGRGLWGLGVWVIGPVSDADPTLLPSSLFISL